MEEYLSAYLACSGAVIHICFSEFQNTFIQKCYGPWVCWKVVLLMILGLFHSPNQLRLFPICIQYLEMIKKENYLCWRKMQIFLSNIQLRILPIVLKFHRGWWWSKDDHIQFSFYKSTYLLRKRFFSLMVMWEVDVPSYLNNYSWLTSIHLKFSCITVLN